MTEEEIREALKFFKGESADKYLCVYPDGSHEEAHLTEGKKNEKKY